MNKTEMQQVLDALQAVEALIEHQYTGTRDGMSALQNAADDAHDALAIMQAALDAPDVDPVALVDYSQPNDVCWGTDENFPDGTPLYAAPQVHLPLSDMEIIRAASALVFSNLNSQMQYIAFARAIEARHGITGVTE